MAVVSDIFDNLKSLITTNIDSEFKELHFVRDLERNDDRILTKGWGLRFLDGPPSDTLTKSYTIDQGFEIVLTRTNLRQQDESQVEDAEKLLFDEMTDILKPLIHSNLNATTGVLKIDQPNFSEPELLNEAHFVALRVQIVITYRQQLT
jgi:hypothetical protein